MKEILVAGQVLRPDAVFSKATVRVQGDKVTALDAGVDARADLTATGWIIPGLIDLQVNGGFGCDVTSDASSTAALAERLPSTGVTAFLPTLISSPVDAYTRSLSELEEIARLDRGAHILGVHLEGPYLHPRRAGAHNSHLLRLPSVQEFQARMLSPGVRLVTLAPELPGALDLVRYLRSRGIVVSAGHSEASYEEARAGFDAGVTWGTHLFNAMSPLTHRAPGLVGALLSSEVPCGLIVDGIHVHPAAVQAAWRAKGPRAITLVTDATAAMGMPPGQNALGDRVMIVDDRSARLADGALAGGILPMNAALQRLMEYTGASLADAATAASATPARVIGVAKGRIAVGQDADLVGLNEALQVEWTMVAGRVVYERG